MLDGILTLWFILTLLSLVYTAFSVSRNPISWVQKLGWLLVVAYAGPIGLFFYFLTCRSPGVGLHDVYTQVNWKQSVNSEVHCLAGDATGIIAAAIVLSFFSLSNGLEVLIEYCTAFIFGWVIFQAGMMVSMFDNYRIALKKTFFAEAVSMNLVMVGMIPTMVILKYFIPIAADPAHSSFWFVMGMATIVGGLTGYPINAWMVKRGLKHGCMTIAEPAQDKMTEGAHMQHAAAHQGHHQHHNHMQQEQVSKGHAHHGHMHHAGLPLWQSTLIVIMTFIAIALAIYIVNLFIPIRL